MLKTNCDVDTSVEKSKRRSSLGEMPHGSTIDSHLNLENVVNVSSIKAEETDSNNTQFSPWMSQKETQEVMSVDETMADGHHKCNICLYNAKCKCDLTRHMFCHRDPINPDTFKCPFCEYKNNERDHNFEAHLLSHHNLPSKQKCSICDYLCNSVHDLNGHLFVHKDTSHIDFFKCSLCKYETKILLNLISHMRVHEKLKCSLCNIEFLNKNDLANHIFKHKDLNYLNGFKCDFCNYKSKYMGSFRLHYNTHKDSFEELTCFICNYKCEAKADLEKHMRLHKDPENVDLFQCYLCEKKTENVEDLIMHLLTHLSVTNQSYCVCLGTYEPPKKKMRKSENYKEIAQKQKCFRCPQCDAKYKTEYSLKKHMLDHEDSSATYNCDHCDYKSKYKELMQKHKKRHQVAKCNFCDLKMLKLDHREHNRIFHSDNTNNPNTVFKCCMCNWNSETRGDLARHLLSHKNADNTCKICNRRIKREMSWISHMLMHSNAHISKTHKCDQCPYFTTSLKYLQGHKETHKDRSERKLFQCPDCKSEYTTKVSLRLHMQDHADKKVIEKLLLYCDLCDFKTKYRCSMKNHKLTHQLVTCTFCNLTMNGSDFKQHNEKLHSDSLEQTKNILECCMCVYKCETKSDLEKHVLVHKDINNICNICGFKNDTEVSWISHVLTHSNDNLKKRHKCDQCHYSTMFFKKLQLHKEKHKERNLLKCAHCNTKFTTKWSLKMHMKNHADSSKVVTYNCDDCGYKTKDKYIYNKHRLRHERSCSFCDMKIIASDLKEHNEIFHSDGLNDSNGLLKCCICSCKCETKSDLAKHLLLHKDSKNTCSLCQCVFKKDISWLSHMLIHSNFDSTKCHRCNQCNYFTTNLKNLERHKEKHENDPEHTLFKCEGCDTKYATKHSLDLHIQDNMDRGDSEQSCDKCDYKTKFRCGMTNHKLGHKLMMCKSCNLTMSGLDLKEHNEIVHSGSSNYISNVWKCSVCDFTSNSKSDLGKHLVIHKKSASNVCDICGFENKNDSSWVSHMLLHSDVNVPKKYKCDQCAYCTAALPNLQRHKETHKDRSKRNLFNCTHCDAKFTTKSSLKYHSHCHADAFYHCDKCDYKSKYEQHLMKHKLIHQLEKCSVCNLEMNESELVTHNKTFHLEVVNDSINGFKCCICPYKCKLRGDLAKHLLLHKDSKNTCIICDYKLKKEVSWLSHMLIHSNVTLRRSYKCDECSYCTTIKTNFDRHKDTHKDRSERDLLECPHCDTKLTTKMSLKVHIQARHTDSSEVRPYNDYKIKYKSKLGNRELKHEELKCSFCHVDVENQSDLEKHIERSHPEHLKGFGILQCGICDNKCETKEDLAKHFLSHKDPTSYSVFKCGTCEYKTRYLNDLKLHKKHDSCLEGGRAAENRVLWEGTWYRCDECAYKSKFKCSFKKHILKHQLGTCSVCNLEMSELDLEAHNKIFHSQVGSDYIDEFKCCMCSYKCKIRDDLAKHLLLHKDPKNTCSICGLKLKKEVSWISHMFIHSNINLKRSYKCDQCPYFTTNKKYMKRHKDTHKDRSERNLFECPHCDAKLTVKKSLKVHIQTRHSNYPEVRTYNDYKTKDESQLGNRELNHEEVKCSFCHVNIENQSKLEKHIERSHRKGLKVFGILKCGICDNKCETKEDLAKHFLLHKDPTSYSVFKCGTCEYKTSYLNNLKLHKKHDGCLEGGHAAESRVPSKVVLYRCDKCDYKSKFERMLKKHKLKHQLGRCSVCNLEMSELDLELHNQIFHEEVISDSTNEFKCCICSYKCKIRGDLAKHLLLHKDSKNTCSICDYKLKKEVSWLSHMLIHSNANLRNSYRCDQCSYCTTIKKNLERHIDTHKDFSERNLFECPHCQAKLTTKMSLKLHIQTRHSDFPEVKMYNDFKTMYKSKLGKRKLNHEEVKCVFCHLNIENESELEKHIESSHPEHLKVFGILHKTHGSCLEGGHAVESKVLWEGTWYRCDVCDYKSKFKCSFKKHMLKHQLGTCSVCNLEMNELDLEAHNKVFHSEVGSDSIDEFKCCICPYKCKIRGDLAKHLLLHKDPKNTCSICGFKLKKEVSWISHMFIHSNANLRKGYKCDQCPYCTTNKTNMERHKDRHKDRSERNLFECPLCDAKLTVKESLKMHIQTRHSNSSEVRTYDDYKTKDKSELGKHKLKHEEVKCSFCHVNIENQSELEKHIQRSHPECPKVLGIPQCGICANSCQTKEDLAKHFLLHKDLTSYNVFKCGTCEYKTRYLNDLKLHKKHGSCLEGVHAAGSRVPSKVVLYRCDKCDYKSKFEHLFTKHKIRHQLAWCSVCDLEMSEVDLEEHNKIIHSEVSSDSTNEFKCCICLYTCQTPGDLAKHLLLHKDPKNTCIICGYKLKKEVSWISHMFIHSNANSSNSYRCDQCPYCTTNKKNLERHKDRHKDRSERNLLECPHCQAKLTTKSSLKLHMQVHLDFSEAITYNCDYCDFKTKYKATYRKHKLRHEEVRCSFCYVNIENQSELEKHIERSHPELLKGFGVLQCGICANRCETKEDLAKHFLLHKDSKSWNVFKCNTCEYKTRYLNNLKLHKKHGTCLEGGRAAESRAPLEGSLYPCDECDYKSKFKYMLKKHKLKHNLGKCSVCSLEMSELDLEAHYKIFHVEVSSDSISEFKCCVCPYKCETRGDLAKHLLLHKDPKNTCNICGCIIRKEVSWICHMFIHSNVNLKKSFKCDQCPYCTTTKKNLERHKDRHKDPSERNLLECPHCDAKLTTKASLKLHIQSHMDPTEVITYNCDHCDYKTKYKSKLGPHNLKYHASGGPLEGALYHCDECEYECKFEPMLKKHKLIHQSGSSEVDLEAHNKICHSEVSNDSMNEFKCDECNYKSRFEHILKKHKLKHQMGTCSVCNLEMSEWDLRSHNETCHSEASNDSINEFKCCVCLSKCETRGDLAKHLLRHNDPKNICSICGYTLKKEVSWISHMLVHSNVTVKKSYYCDQCSYCTTIKKNFLRHKATHRDLSERNLLECPHCHAKLASKASLKVHIQNHLDASEVITYNCDYCDYKTNYRLKLRKHKLKHEGEKCSICHLNIKNPSELKRHIESSHPERLKVFGIVQCCLCDTKCETKEGLAKHFLLHKDPTCSSVFKCDICDYKSRYLNHLKLHKKRGSCLQRGDGTEDVIQDNKVKLFQCEEYPFHSVYVPQFDKHLQQPKPSEREMTHCNETKSSKTIKIVSRDKAKSKSPNVHVKNKHPKLLYTYKCCICCRKFCFTTKDKLSRHLLFHKDPNNPKNYKCKLCSYTVRHLAHFKLHFHPHKPVKSNTATEVITTTEADTLKCDICPFEASEPYKLKRHKDTHKDPSERQFFTCVHCDSKYQFKSSLTKHIKKRHSGT